MILNKHNTGGAWATKDQFFTVSVTVSLPLCCSVKELITGRHEQKRRRKSKKAITNFVSQVQPTSKPYNCVTDLTHLSDNGITKPIVSTLDLLSSIRSSGEWEHLYHM